MHNGSSDRYTPAFITPKIDRPNIVDCRWHLLIHFDTTPCDRGADPPMRGAPIILCEKHQEEIAAGVGWLSPERATHNLHERAERVARTKLALKDETIAALREKLEEPTPAKRKRGTPTNGHVYFLLSDNLVKIGWASDLDARMKAYSPGARILAVMPGTKADETRQHRKYADLKTNRREWFTYHPRIMEEVERIVREHGEPPRDLNEPMVTKRIIGPRLDRPTQRRARSLGK